MPRPTVHQVLYGSATVVGSTTVLLVLSGATSTVGVAALCAAGWALGLLVALVTAPRRSRSLTVAKGRAAASAADPMLRVGSQDAGAEQPQRVA
jgi:hypothetical protein